jgi:hypothetical protein
MAPPTIPLWAQAVAGTTVLALLAGYTNITSVPASPSSTSNAPHIRDYEWCPSPDTDDESADPKIVTLRSTFPKLESLRASTYLFV